MVDPQAQKQLQSLRETVATATYGQVQQDFWSAQHNKKRSAPTPVGSGLTTPVQESEDASMVELSHTASALPSPETQPSLLLPFTIDDSTAVGLTASDLGVDINDHTAVQAWLGQPVQSKQQVYNLVRGYHRHVIRPEYYNLVVQLEQSLKGVEDEVFQTKQELQWMAEDNRQQQKQLSGLQVLTSGWPQHLKPEERHYMIGWMLAQVPRVYTFMKERGLVTDHTAHEMPRYLNVLQTDPTTIRTGSDFYSSMTILLFKSWDLRSAFMERYGGSAGVPLYTDESTSVPKSHIRTTPASPQWQRKLELPLRIILACINASTDHTATTRLTVLWIDDHATSGR